MTATPARSKIFVKMVRALGPPWDVTTEMFAQMMVAKGRLDAPINPIPILVVMEMPAP
jgi:hypothetical protein